VSRCLDAAARGGDDRSGPGGEDVDDRWAVRPIKEALGGYLVYEADDLDAAIDLASRIPAASMGGAVEVRPLKER
jgi:hypothetical protein